MPSGGQAVSYSISILLTRNLHDVFGEKDPARRRAAIDGIFTEDCVFYAPTGVYRGRDEIDRVASAIKARQIASVVTPIVVALLQSRSYQGHFGQYQPRAA
jgi:hypothetical protein